MNLIIDAANIRAGGGLTHLIELLGSLDEVTIGFDKIFLFAPSKSLDKIKETEKLKKVYVKALNGNYLNKMIWRKTYLKRFAKKNRALVFIPGTGMSGVKFVTMCRNLLPIEIKELNRFSPSLTWVRLLILRWLHFKAYNTASGVIFLNRYCYQAIPTSVRNKISSYDIVAHGIHPRFFKKRPQYSKGESFKIIYVSIINLYKHQWIVADTVLQLRQKGYPIELHLVGPFYPAAKQKLDKVISSYEDKAGVIYYDKIPYDELDKMYDDVDAAIYASTCETFGMTLLEAMAAALPIACSNKSSMSEMLKDAGVYFDPEDVESTKEAILTLYQSEELRQSLGQKAQSYARHYDWKETAKKTFQYLEKIAENTI